jgi:hypothetical protein
MWQKAKDLARSFKRELRIYQSVLADSRTPIRAKIFLGLSCRLSLYALRSDPGFYPGDPSFGRCDYRSCVVYLALRFIPAELMDEHRRLNALKAS